MMNEFDDSVPITHEAFAPYSKAIGEIVIAWNGLHNILALIFNRLLNVEFDSGLAIWHAVRTDRHARDMLKAFIDRDDETRKRFPELQASVDWLIKEADGLEEGRNRAVHSPYWGYQRSADEIIIMPIVGNRNRNAKQLWNEGNLLAVFHYYRDVGLCLSGYASSLLGALNPFVSPWPEKPKLPPKPPKANFRWPYS